MRTLFKHKSAYLTVCAILLYLYSDSDIIEITLHYNLIL